MGATGLNDGMWLRIANIQVLDEDYSGMSQQCDGTWVYSENGNVDTKYTGMAANDSGWWYFNDGEIDWDYTGMAQNENGWWYYRNGRIDWSYTGEGTCQYGTWYYQNGRIPYGLTGMVLTDKEWAERKDRDRLYGNGIQSSGLVVFQKWRDRLELHRNGAERKRLVVLPQRQDRLELYRRGNLSIWYVVLSEWTYSVWPDRDGINR